MPTYEELFYWDTCKHCGLVIRSTNAASWVHDERPARHLHRCQTPGFAYGYDATPTFDEGPCDCWACLQFGQRNAKTLPNVKDGEHAF